MGILKYCYQGGPDASKVRVIDVAVYDKTGTPYDQNKKAYGSDLGGATGTALNATGGNVSWGPTKPPQPGYTMTIKGVATSDEERVVVTAKFNDGSNQVLLDKQL